MQWSWAACLVWTAGPVQAVPLAQSVYVWQRDQAAAVDRAVEACPPQVGAFDVLAAEARWAGGAGEVTWVRPAKALRESLRPKGIVVRIGAVSGEPKGFEPFVESLCHEALRRAEAAGLAVRELQIDYDCAEGSLPAYARWLAPVRDSVAPVPVCFTALPVWLAHREDFAALAAVADGYILQVHSISRPTTPDAPFALCDPDRARVWARKAASFGRPFRIALPTYGYRVGFGPKGSFLGLEAEGVRPDWPAGTILRAVFSDPVALAGLVRDWLDRPPAHCEGLIWFRLPVGTDTLTWAPLTWRRVMDGVAPVSRLEVEVAESAGLVDISIVNRGERSELPSVVTVSWPAGETPAASDAFGGFVLESHPAQSEERFTSARLAEGDRLAPGQRRAIAWIRFSHDVHVVASLAQPP